MNSFRFLERGIEAEIARQTEIWSSGRQGRPGDAPLRSRHRLAHAASLEGGGARLPLLPGARPRAAGADRRRCSKRRAPRCPSCRPRASQRYEARLRPADRRRRGAGRLGGARAVSSRSAWPPATASTPGRWRGWTTGELVARLREQGVEDPRDSKLSPRRARRAGGDGAGPLALAVGGEGGARRADAVRRRAAAVVEAKGLAPIADSGELEAIVERAIEAESGRGRADPQAEAAGRQGRSWAR